MPKDLHDHSAMFSQVGFHFKKLFGCLGLGIAYAVENFFLSVISYIRAVSDIVSEYVGDRLPYVAALLAPVGRFTSRHLDAVFQYRSVLFNRFAYYMLVGFAVSQVPWLFVVKHYA